MKKIAVLGAGLVGKAMAIDLAGQHEVTSIDLSMENLNAVKAHGVRTLCADLSQSDTLQRLLEPYDLVVGALPGFMGFKTAQAVIGAGKNMVDISFFPEDPFPLDALAKEKGVTVVVDCGVAPGLGNIILGHHDRQMKVSSYHCLVGGLPVVREWPYQYKAVFSPIDVIEEYMRPARFVEHGALIVREALSDPELVHFNGIGTLESWNSDGLRTLLQTMKHIPNMIEKTLRYPGCIEYLRVLRESGFFSQEKVTIDGKEIRPLDVTAKLLFPLWKLKPGEKEFTVMKIVIQGEAQGKTKTLTYHLLDHTHEATQTLSMARTTGYTCTATANLVLDGTFNQKGVCPPEYLGQAGHYPFILEYLERRGVKIEGRENEG